MEVKLLSQNTVIDLLRNVQCVGHNQEKPYANADIKFEYGVYRADTTPAQAYVLRPKLEFLSIRYDRIEYLFDFNVRHHGCGFLIDGVPLLPPILEGDEMLVCDGMHRIQSAHMYGAQPFCAIHITNPSLPYYAYPLEGGWDAVQVLESIPTGYVKKNYREPENHKALFRNFNAQFPGIQEKR